jgi:hypothetical protein
MKSVGLFEMPVTVCLVFITFLAFWATKTVGVERYEGLRRNFAPLFSICWRELVAYLASLGVHC